MYRMPPKSCSIACPSCRSARISKSRRKGLTEFLLHTLLFRNPYRCLDCDLRFFRVHLSRSSKHRSAKPVTRGTY